MENRSVVQTLIQAAQDPTKALVFNYASEALNNSFFLSTLVRLSFFIISFPADALRMLQSPTATKPTLKHQSKFSDALARSSLKSLPQLISTFSAHVAGLHPSSGAYVWLVTDQRGNLGIVGTYAGGSLLVQANVQMKKGWSGLEVLGETKENILADELREGEGRPIKPSTNESAASSASLSKPSRRSFSTTPSRPAFGDSSYANLANELNRTTISLSSDVGQQLHPLLCLSVHEHCYLLDYGVWGREEYVKNWWGFVDWKKVEEAFETVLTDSEAR